MSVAAVSRAYATDICRYPRALATDISYKGKHTAYKDSSHKHIDQNVHEAPLMKGANSWRTHYVRPMYNKHKVPHVGRMYGGGSTWSLPPHGVASGRLFQDLVPMTSELQKYIGCWVNNRVRQLNDVGWRLADII